MKKIPVVHPFLFAIYPVLFLFSQNIAQVFFSETWVPIAIALGFTLIMLLLMVLIFMDIEKAGIITSVFLVLFFSFGHLFKVINQWGIGNPVYLLLIQCVIIAGSVYFLKKTQLNLHNFGKLLNVIAACLIVFPIFHIGVFGFKTGALPQYNVSTKDSGNHPIKTGKTDKPPNIFYIILDAYARQDVLKEIFDYSNDEFIHSLVSKGFYVADKSTANYCFTQLSLASSLNSSYLDLFAKGVGDENTDYAPLFEAILNNRASGFLEQQGYKAKFVLSAGTGLERFAAPNLYALKRNKIWLANAFHEMVLNSTPIPYLLRDTSSKVFDEFDFHRKQVLYAFNKVVDLSSFKGPLFVFAHIIKPHVPFVFSATGTPIAPHRQQGLWYSVQKGMGRNEYLDLYKQQLSFINEQVVKMVDEILSNSSEPPIIILQSDHGPILGEGSSLADTKLNILLPILNAYYLPDDGKKHLYPTISPVNTFRVIFKHYFNMDINTLPDESYYALIKYPYKYYKITEKIKGRD